jgi:hypothetical protein
MLLPWTSLLLFDQEVMWRAAAEALWPWYPLRTHLGPRGVLRQHHWQGLLPGRAGRKHRSAPPDRPQSARRSLQMLAGVAANW